MEMSAHFQEWLKVPITRKILVIFEPKTLPITISEAPFVTAIIDEISSGREVPTPTITTPVINEDILKESPIFSAAPVK